MNLPCNTIVPPIYEECNTYIYYLCDERVLLLVWRVFFDLRKDKSIPMLNHGLGQSRNCEMWEF